MLHLLISLATFAAPAASSSSPKTRDVHDMIVTGRMVPAEAAIADGLDAAGKNPEAREPWLFLKAWSALKADRPQVTVEACDQLLASKPLLEEEIRSLRAEALAKLGRRTEAAAEDERLLDLGPNFLLRFEASMRAGRAKLTDGHARDARKLFTALEKRTRGTPWHADVMIELARAERRGGSSTVACKWLRKLYERHPGHPAIREWGADLAAAEFDGKRTGCHNTKEDFRDRVRALLWNGDDEKARQEVQDVAQALASEDRFGADEMRAWFLLQTGSPDEAFQLLQNIYPQRKSDSSFLTTYASAAARSEQGAAAVGAYHRLYESLGRSAAARKALYQSAFLSYQFRDYDGATRRFQEFIKKYPTSGLSRDARWNLAWLSYLKGDYATAVDKFNSLSTKSSAGRDRARYWKAMAHLRLNQPEKARPLFSSLAADRSGSYYGAAARQRLARLPAAWQATPVATETPRLTGPASIAEILLPMDEPSADDSPADSAESEEALVAEASAPTDAPTGDDNDEATTDLAQESGRSDVFEEARAMHAPATGKRFEKAKSLLSMGFTEHARWELFEIERRTHGRDEMKALLAVYEESAQFHRSSAIAQLRFGAVRVHQGFEGARALWEAAYPRAFADEVKAGAKENALPEEFIWGIMRAESQYRRDAVSPVGAMGLMQIMPATGRKIASLRKDGEFTPPRLLEPATAVRYGSFYLKRLSKFFDGSIPLTAAAYNAGPHRVHSWLMSFGALDMDEFIEHIPFLETREYVRKVVGNAMVYASLYGNKKEIVNLASPLTVKGRPEWSRKEIWD